MAIPTETVYGLGADGLNPEAVAKIFEAKGRPGDNPLILHVTGPEQLPLFCHHIPVSYTHLATMIKVDISNVWGQLALPDLLALEKEVSAAHKTLMEGTGEGNDFLGWLSLPTYEETEEMRRIAQAAARIRESSEAFVVAVSYTHLAPAWSGRSVTSRRTRRSWPSWSCRCRTC